MSGIESAEGANAKIHIARFWGGPLDGEEQLIERSYPPRELNGYPLSYSMNGRYYVYCWPKQVTQGAQR